MGVSFFNSYKHLISKDCVITEIYFFTAIQSYLKKERPEKILKHENYLTCLENTDVKIERGRFKRKIVRHQEKRCKIEIQKFEEKETDVSIAIKMFDLMHNNKCDVCILVTGDTDLVPAIKSCKYNFDKEIVVMFPFCRSISKQLTRAFREYHVIL